MYTIDRTSSVHLIVSVWSRDFVDNALIDNNLTQNNSNSPNGRVNTSRWIRTSIKTRPGLLFAQRTGVFSWWPSAKIICICTIIISFVRQYAWRNRYSCLLSVCWYAKRKWKSSEVRARPTTSDSGKGGGGQKTEIRPCGCLPDRRVYADTLL